MQLSELQKYILNGVVATLVHYCVLTIIIESDLLSSAGVANLIASMFGIAASFCGNRYFVFRESSKPIVRQGINFIVLYAGIALLQGFTLFLWTDLLKFDYRLGFLISTGLQFICSYVGNKLIVFRS